jgi:hypothetical protein
MSDLGGPDDRETLALLLARADGQTWDELEDAPARARFMGYPQMGEAVIASDWLAAREQAAEDRGRAEARSEVKFYWGDYRDRATKAEAALAEAQARIADGLGLAAQLGCEYRGANCIEAGATTTTCVPCRLRAALGTAAGDSDPAEYAQYIRDEAGDDD